jgi:hypothetical protein
MVWYGIYATFLRPYFIDTTANGKPFCAMLNEVLKPYTDDILLLALWLFWFHQEEAPPHFVWIMCHWFKCPENG